MVTDSNSFIVEVTALFLDTDNISVFCVSDIVADIALTSDNVTNIISCSVDVNPNDLFTNSVSTSVSIIAMVDVISLVLRNAPKVVEDASVVVDVSCFSLARDNVKLNVSANLRVVFLNLFRAMVAVSDSVIVNIFFLDRIVENDSDVVSETVNIFFLALIAERVIVPVSLIVKFSTLTLFNVADTDSDSGILNTKPFVSPVGLNKSRSDILPRCYRECCDYLGRGWHYWWCCCQICILNSLTGCPY